jgi:hypothetical protein
MGKTKEKERRGSIFSASEAGSIVESQKKAKSGPFAGSCRKLRKSF